MGILSRGYIPILEAYVGKSKELIYAERELQKVIDAMQLANKNFKIPQIYSMVEFNNMERSIEKAFKLKNLCITFHYGIPLAPISTYEESYTLPYTLKFFKYDKDFKMNPSEMVVGVSIDVNLITQFDLNAGEVMSIIIHEIGHNFDTSIFSYLAMMGKLFSFRENKNVLSELFYNLVAAGLSDFINLGYLRELIIKTVTGFLAKYAPIVLKATEVVARVYGELEPLFKLNNVMGIPEIFSPDFFLEFLHPKNLFGYGMEKYADSFVTAHGYAIEHQSYRAKIIKRENFIVESTIRDIPGLNWAYDLISIFGDVIISASAPQQKDIARMNEHLIRLKRDVEDPNLHPKLKKEVRDQIKFMELYMDDYLDISKNDNKKRIFSWLYNYMTIKLFNNKVDYRELFEAISRHEV